MKIAFAGKGGVGKTSIAAWTADWLARNGKNVWLIDADTALSLGQACGLAVDALPEPLICRNDLIKERIHDNGFLNLNPEVGDLPEKLAVDIPITTSSQGVGKKRLIVMGAVTNAGGGCACAANALLKALLAHLVIDRNDWVLVDLEAGVEHLGRGTVAHVDGLVIVSEPSMRSLNTGAEIGRMATHLGLNNQLLMMNRFIQGAPPTLSGLPTKHFTLPSFPSLMDRQMTETSVLNLRERDKIDTVVEKMINAL